MGNGDAGVSPKRRIADDSRSELVALVRRANRGDEQAEQRVVCLLKEVPALKDLMDAWGNMAEQAESALVDLASGDDKLLHESVRRQIRALRSEIAGPAPTPLERLLAERVALCWFQATCADSYYARKVQAGVSFAEGDYLQRVQDRTHRRYLQSIKALAQVRRLLIPPVQVNIADQQVNVSG